MTPDERTRLETIDTLLQSETVQQQIRPVVERVRAELARNKSVSMTWEPISLSVFGQALPHEIRSAWVFVLRAGVDTGAERHPNSHQRMMTLAGSGDMQTGEPGKWQSNILINDPAAPLAPAGCEVVVARLALDFRAELHWPGVVDIVAASERDLFFERAFDCPEHQAGCNASRFGRRGAGPLRRSCLGSLQFLLSNQEGNKMPQFGSVPLSIINLGILASHLPGPQI